MISIKHSLSLPAIVAITTLTACGSSEMTTTSTTATSTSSTPSTAVAPGSAVSSGGVFTTTQGTKITILPASSFTLNGQKAWSSGGNAANSYVDTNVVAVGGLQNNVPFAGISGTTSTPVVSGTSAVYSGRYAATSVGLATSGNFDMVADFSGGTVAGTAGSFSVTGTISGNDFTGTAQFGSQTADLVGGFYGTKDMAGAFSGDAIGGIIYGTAP